VCSSDLSGLFVGEQPEGNVIAFPNPSEFPKGSPNGGGPKGGRKVRQDFGDTVKAEIVRLISSGQRFDSQETLRSRLNETFGADAVKAERLSVWLGELGPTVPRTVEGRRKVIG
jgi:hypothetical protein